MPKAGDVVTYVIKAFSGGMNTVSEENNLITLDPNSKLGAAFVQARTEFRNIDNFRPQNRGGQSKTFGFDLFKNTAVSSPITGLYRYIKADGTSLFMFSQADKVYKLVAGTITDIGASVSSGAYIHFETAFDKLIICDGVNAPETWDGSSNGTLTNAPSVLKMTLLTQNRLWGTGNTGTNASYVYHSDAGTSDNMANNFVACDLNDGQKITSIAEFFIPGELTPVIIVTKERSIGLITGSGTVADPYFFVKLSHEIGVPGFRQVQQWAQNAAMLTPRGIQSYKTLVQNSNIAEEMLTGKVFDQFTSIPQTYLPNAFSWHDWKFHRLGFAVPHDTAQYPNRIWFYDTEDGSMYKQTGFSLTAGFVDTDGTFYHGDETGKIYVHGTTYQDYDGGAISASMSTGFMDFFEPDLYKQIEHCKLLIRGDGAYTMGVGTQLNYGAQPSSSHTVNLTAGAYTWNGGTWTDDPDVYQWGGAPLQAEVFFPKNIFRSIQFTFTQSGANQPLDLFEFVIRVKYLDIF